MTRTKRYTDQDIVDKAKEVESLTGLLKALNLRPAGGSFINMKRNLQRLNVNTLHWTGQAWTTGKQLKDFTHYTRAANAKKHIIKQRGHKCEECDLKEWKNKPIMLEIDHIDGDRTNNNPSNWKLLCPNCHSQTPTWRNRKQWVTKWE